MTTEVNITRILETALYVSNIAVSRIFYGKLFNFPEMLRDDRLCALAVPGRQVLLLFRIGGSIEASRTPYGGIPGHNSIGHQHLCFAISAQSVDFWETRLSEYGIPVESKLIWPQGATSIYFRDPDGHSLELSTPRLWPNDDGVEE